MHDGIEVCEGLQQGVLILSAGNTPMVDQNTGRDSSHKELWLHLPGSGMGRRFKCPLTSQILAWKQPGFGASTCLLVFFFIGVLLYSQDCIHRSPSRQFHE